MDVLSKKLIFNPFNKKTPKNTFKIQKRIFQKHLHKDPNKTKTNQGEFFSLYHSLL